MDLRLSGDGFEVVCCDKQVRVAGNSWNLLQHCVLCVVATPHGGK